jgi:WD40 repeat protein
VWDAARQSILWEERRGSGPYRVALPPDGRWLATADGKGRLQIWEPATGKRFGRCPPLDGDCLGLAFAPDGARVAWAARAGAHTQLGQLDLDTMETQVRQGGGIGLTYLSDGQTLAWVHPTEGLITHGLTGRATQPLYGAAVGIPRGLAFSPDGRTLAVASDEPRLRLFDPATGRMTGAVPGLVGPGDHDRLTWVRFLPDGRTLLGGTWTRAYCWEVATGRPPIGREEAVPRIGNVVVAPDGKTALAIGADLAVWDLTGPLPTPRQVLGDRPRWVRGVAYTPDGARVVAHDWIRDELLVSPLPPPGGSWAFQTVASVPGTTGSPPLLGILAGGQRMAFSHSAGQLAVYDLTTGQAAASFTAPPTGTAWALSPNGRLLAQGDRGGTVRVWDVATWKSRAVFTHGHQDQAITALAWDPAGRRLASGGADKGIIVWDVTAGGKP